MNVIAKTKSIKGILKKGIIGALLCATAVSFTACGGTKFEGVYVSTSSSGVTIFINGDGTANYREFSNDHFGTWFEKDGKLYMDFNREVSLDSEPLVVTMEADDAHITITSFNQKWSPEYYVRKPAEVK